MVALNDADTGIRVAHGVGINGNLNLRPIAYNGHCLYARVCLFGEADGPEWFQRKVGLISLPQTAKDGSTLADRTDWAEVLAVGENVGKPCLKSHQHKFKRARCLAPIYKPGQRILLPKVVGAGMNRSTANWRNEYFVEESMPLCVVEDDG